MFALPGTHRGRCLQCRPYEPLLTPAQRSFRLPDRSSQGKIRHYLSRDRGSTAVRPSRSVAVLVAVSGLWAMNRSSAVQAGDAMPQNAPLSPGTKVQVAPHGIWRAATIERVEAERCLVRYPGILVDQEWIDRKKIRLPGAGDLQDKAAEEHRAILEKQQEFLRDFGPQLGEHPFRDFEDAQERHQQAQIEHAERMARQQAANARGGLMVIAVAVGSGCILLIAGAGLVLFLLLRSASAEQADTLQPTLAAPAVVLAAEIVPAVASPFAMASRAVQPATSSHAPSPTGAWRQGNLLVMHSRSALPDFCIKCNAPARHRIWVDAIWYPWWGLFGGFFAYVKLRRRVKINVVLCDSHQEQQQSLLSVGKVIMATGILASAVGFFWMMFIRNPGPDYVLFFGGILVFLGGIVFNMAASRVVAPKHIKAGYVWLKGLPPEYLARFDEIPP